MVLEVILALISPYPYMNTVTFTEYNKEYKTEIRYSANEFLLAFSFLRIYLLARCAIALNKYQSPRAFRVCQMSGCEADSMFAIKSILREYPYETIVVSFMTTIMMIGYQLKIFEAPISDASG